MANARPLGSPREIHKYLLVVPGLLIFLVGVIGPILLGFYFSLTDWDGLSPVMNFIGFENYLSLFQQERFWNSLRFTLLFVVTNTIIQNILSLALATLLDQPLRGKNLVRTIVFVPALLSPIIIGYLWGQLFTTVFPNLITTLGLSFNGDLLGNPDTVLGGLLMINNWMWVGYWMMIYLAALQSVPLELYESATIDGAGKLRQFFQITLPMIVPAITVCLVSITLGSFQVYELILTSSQGGPGHTSESFVMYVFNMAFSAQKPAFASANSMIYIVLLIIVAVVQIRATRSREVQL